jgi:serine O-acetyltransferase
MKLKQFILSDLYRYTAKKNLNLLLKHLLFNPGFKYTFWMRMCAFLRRYRLILLPLYLMSRWILNHYRFKYGISIPYNTKIGSGLYIGHYGGIIVNANAVIGKNCNINQGVTIGITYGGKNPGTPVIGDNVYIGPGSFVIGSIKIGNNVAIGAASVVINSVNDKAVVVGNPARQVSKKGSGEYVINTDYEQK